MTKTNTRICFIELINIECNQIRFRKSTSEANRTIKMHLKIRLHYLAIITIHWSLALLAVTSARQKIKFKARASDFPTPFPPPPPWIRRNGWETHKNRFEIRFRRMERFEKFRIFKLGIQQDSGEASRRVRSDSIFFCRRRSGPEKRNQERDKNIILRTWPSRQKLLLQRKGRQGKYIR